jgi:uncharacterized protein YoxC
MVVLVILAIGVLATLLQVRRTARKFEAFLEAAQRDLASITTDVHVFRLHLEELITPLRTTTRELSDFAQVLGEAAQGLRGIQRRVQEGWHTAGSYLSGLRTGLGTLLPFVKL